MSLLPSTFLIFLLSFMIVNAITRDQYMQKRSQLIQTESNLKLSAFLPPLTQREQQVEQKLAYVRSSIINNSANGFINFPPRQGIFEGKSFIDQSQLFKWLKTMPKGGLLHTHPDSLHSFDRFVSYWSYQPICYVFRSTSKRTQRKQPSRFDLRHYALLVTNAFHTPFLSQEDGQPLDGVEDAFIDGTFAMFPSQPADRRWTSVPALRAASGNATLFDLHLLRSLQLNDDPTDPDKLNAPVVPTPWYLFNIKLARYGPAFLYLDLFRDSFSRLWADLGAEGISLLETRWIPGSLYTLNQTVLPPQQYISVLLDTLQKYNTQTNSSMEVRFQYTAMRSANASFVMQQLQEAVSYRQNYPNLIVGFDLVGQEDPGHTLLYFLDDFLAISNLNQDFHSAGANTTFLPFNFHAGETNWISNENLYDAILLGTERIGHGFQLHSHPLLRELTKTNKIAIEVCPISNQVLGYVSDLRVHPGVVFITEGLWVTLSPDDPASFGLDSPSYDWWMAYVGWNLGLADLKQLAINSINFSTLDSALKQNHLALWRAKWDLWISSF